MEIKLSRNKVNHIPFYMIDMVYIGSSARRDFYYDFKREYLHWTKLNEGSFKMTFERATKYFNGEVEDIPELKEVLEKIQKYLILT